MQDSCIRIIVMCRSLAPFSLSLCLSCPFIEPLTGVQENTLNMKNTVVMPYNDF